MCGIIGVYNHPEAATLTYLGLFALQHRGQESAGICSDNGKQMFQHREMGLVSKVFENRETLNRLLGRAAIGHNRYSTTGSSSAENIQPLVFRYQSERIAIAHNGNLVNIDEIRRNLEKNGTIFQTTTDTEIIVHLAAHSAGKSIEEKFLNAFRQISGAYSIVTLVNDSMIIARDPHGFRPLCMGKLGDAFVFASESCAFDLIGAEYLRDIEPGEMLLLKNGGEVKSFRIAEATPHYCIFEFVYFSRPDSRIFGEYVDKRRRKLGKNLALEHPPDDGEIVISVPDSSNTAALGYSQRSDIRFEIGLIRNHYIGRTFIHPLQSMRDFSVRIKLNPVGGVLENRSIVLVDDSIVRGTTLKKLARLLRQSGVRKIHVRISSPPIRYSCYYGMDFPSQEELIAPGKSVAEIKKYLNVDSLKYLSKEKLLDAMINPPHEFCTACFTGKYPIKIKQNKYRKEKFEQ